jgi:methyl halide transferase
VALTDPAHSAFWQAIYDGGTPPWDQGQAAPPLVRAIETLSLPPGSRALVPGCGFGHEAIFLAGLGYAVTAVDFASGAVNGLRGRVDETGLAIDVVQADLFDLPRTLDGTFDLLLEHTCFCAIPLNRRADYVGVAARLLQPGASLVGLFFEVDHRLEDGPPFATTRADVMHYFEPSFDVEGVEQPQDSFPGRNGREWLSTMRRK